MCGIIYIASQFVIFASLLQPLSKKRSIVLLVNTLIVAIPTIILWIISKNINNGLFGLAFNKLNGQCLITMLLTFIVFTSLYYVITYLIDNYKKGGDK